MKKAALINGKILDIHTNTQSILNIVIANEKIIGLGYVPDDDDATVIDIANTLVIPGIQLSPPANIPVLTSEMLYNPSATDALFQLNPTLVVTHVSGSELLYAIQLATQHRCNLHVILKNVDSDLTIVSQAKASQMNITAALPYILLVQNPSVKNSLAALSKSKTIDCLYATESQKTECITFCFNDLLTYLTLPEVVALIAQNPSKLFGQKISTFSLLSKPSFMVINPKKVPCIRLEVTEGKFIQTEENK